MDKLDLIKRLKEEGLVAVVRADSKENGEKLIEIYYKYNNKSSVRKIEFVYNENEVSTYNGKAYVSSA